MTPAPADVRGFNYSGSWGSSGLDLWAHHDRELMAVEVARGKEYFPGWNVARWWLSQEAFARRPEQFLSDFAAGLEVFDRHGISVIPVLFNQWHEPTADFGGIYLDHLLGGAWPPADSTTDDDASAGYYAPIFRRYLDALVGAHRDDPRIYAWDVCNEPLGESYFPQRLAEGQDPEDPWAARKLDAGVRFLAWCARAVKRAGATQPVVVGSLPGVRSIELTEPFTDLLTFHPYYIPSAESREEFEQNLDAIIAYAATTGKELLPSETVWGSTSDVEREEILRYTLGVLKDRGLGFIVHALHHSLVADLHSAEHGSVGGAGRLEFIEADGSLRAGHGAFNDF